MKTNIQSIVALVVLGWVFNVATLSFVQAFASSPDSNRLVSSSSVQMSTEGITQFEAFMRKRSDNPFSNAADRQTFAEVVGLYNADLGGLGKLSTEKRSQFQVVVAKLDARLAKMKGTEAAAWRSQVTNTVEAINFWMNFTLLNDTTEEEVAAPMIGR
ncbi:MAG: hypothetical protein H7Z75_00130 [Ferruginibacter sp.]|nr:hypothetical protein [Cytophagales bacterium]